MRSRALAIMTRHAAMMLTEKQKGGDEATTAEEEELRFDRSNVTSKGPFKKEVRNDVPKAGRLR